MKTKEGHLYEIKDGNSKVLFLSVEDADDKIRGYLIPSDISNKHNFNRVVGMLSNFDDCKEVFIEKYSIYKPKLEVKLDILEFENIEDMVLYYQNCPIEKYSIYYNSNTELISLYDKNNIKLFDLKKENIDVLRNFGFIFKLGCKKYYITQKEMYFLLAHQDEEYWFRKIDGKVVIANNEKYTETTLLFNSIPYIDNIKVKDLIIRCIVMNEE